MRPSEASAPRRDLSRTAAVALGARLLVAALAWGRFPVIDDGVFYDTLARRLAQGAGYTWLWSDGAVTPVAHYPVGYPALLAVTYWGVGARAGSALLLHAVVGALGAVAVHAIAARAASRAAARGAGLVVALHPALLFYEPAVMTEAVASALLALPFAVAVSSSGSRATTLAKSFAAGALLGVATLVRPQALLVLPVMAWLAGEGSPLRRQTVAAWAFVVAGTAAVLAPWTARNERVFGRAVVVSANGGWNLLIGTDAAARGGWRPLETPEACRGVWDEAAKDACFGRVAVERVAGDPLGWAGLVPGKLAATFDVGGSGPSYLARSRPDLVSRPRMIALGAVETIVERAALIALLVVVGGEGGARRLPRLVLAGASVLACLTWHAWPAYVGLLALLLARGASRWAAEPLVAVTAAVLGSTLLTHAVFFGAGRYALLVVPWIASLAVVEVMRAREASGRSLETPTRAPLG